MLNSAIAATVLLASSSLAYPSHLFARNYVSVSQMSESYDYIIAGGGLAGLALASRLSENSSLTVLVIEAGGSGDDVRERIDTPWEAYFHGVLYSGYDWQYITEPQEFVNARNLSWPRGKILGGSAAVNGMYMVRPSALEFNEWQQLQNGADGADSWGWDSMYAAMKKSETFTPPSDEVATNGNIKWNADSHGTSGPLHTTFPGYVSTLIGQWTPTLANIGVPASNDPDGGSGWGAFVATSAINPTNWTRSYSKSAYIDPLPPRDNLHILWNQTVTRFFTESTSDGVRATRVEFANNGYQSTPWPTVNVNKELLLNGGAIGSPNILMQSGIGPQDVLTSAGVSVVVPLPGVGHHVQDHLSAQLIFKTTGETAAEIHATGTTDPAKESFVNSAIAYVNISDLVGDYASTFHDEILANLTAYASDPVRQPSTDDTVKAGYQAIYQANANMLLTQTGQIELLLSTTGSTLGGTDSIAVQAALQHPFSQGSMYIRNNNPFDYPVIQPSYLSHPADLVMVREGLKLARTVARTEPLASLVGEEINPGADVQTDEQWEAWLRNSVGTEYHPSGSCAMLPKELGGVIDSKMKVYGTTNVRVTDGSIFPIQFAAHLMAPLYGTVEKAAEIILAENSGTSVSNTQTNSSSGTSNNGSSSSSSDSSSNNSAAALFGSKSMSRIAISSIVALVLGTLIV